MCSLAYNIGIGNFLGSSVLRFHRAGEHHEAAAAFNAWNKGGGRVLPGLVRRRAAEAALYLTPDAAAGASA
jgi:lysozyme